MFKKFIAFTLAEVMLVAGITAVVAAMTVPNMKKSFDKKARISKAKAVMAKLDNALQNIDIDNVMRGKTTTADRSLAMLNELENHLQFRLVCGKQSSSNYCFTKNLINDSTLFSRVFINKGSECSTAILNDGTELALCWLYYPLKDIDSCPLYGGFFGVDVDGANKGPQTRGEDVFMLGISGTGVAILNGNLESDVFN